MADCPELSKARKEKHIQSLESIHSPNIYLGEVGQVWGTSVMYMLGHVARGEVVEVNPEVLAHIMSELEMDYEA
ncbi:hypothetical protein ACHQM5_026597 [Ranunculus cassubicifolius]